VGKSTSEDGEQLLSNLSDCSQKLSIVANSRDHKAHRFDCAGSEIHLLDGLALNVVKDLNHKRHELCEVLGKVLLNKSGRDVQ